MPLTLEEIKSLIDLSQISKNPLTRQQVMPQSDEYTKTRGGLTYSSAAGRQWFARSKPTLYNGWLIPGEDVASMTQKEIKSLIDLIQTSKNPLTKQQVLEILGGASGKNEKWAFYQQMLDVNKDNGIINYDSSIYLDESGQLSDVPNLTNVDTQKNDSLTLGQEYNPSANYYDMITQANSADAQNYRDAMYGSIARQEQEVDSTLAAAELDAYKMLGQQQLQLERQIADNRMRMLRSGTTSAQLASMELQNMFSGQNAAMGIAQQVMNQRVQNKQQFAQQRGAVEPGLYDLISQNKGTLAQVEAQRFAAQKGFEGYSPAYQGLYMDILRQQNPTAASNFERLIKPTKTN